MGVSAGRYGNLNIEELTPLNYIAEEEFEESQIKPNCSLESKILQLKLRYSGNVMRR